MSSRSQQGKRRGEEVGLQGRAVKCKCPEPRLLESLLGGGRGLTLKSCVSQLREMSAMELLLAVPFGSWIKHREIPT